MATISEESGECKKPEKVLFEAVLYAVYVILAKL